MREPFKGTASVWYSNDGRMTPVSKLTDKHLVNIFSRLHELAENELRIDNPYGRVFIDSPNLSHTPQERRIWILENCITYPALEREAVKRNLWDYRILSAKLPEEKKLPVEEIYRNKVNDLMIAVRNLQNRVYKLEKLDCVTAKDSYGNKEDSYGKDINFNDYKK